MRVPGITDKSGPESIRGSAGAAADRLRRRRTTVMRRAYPTVLGTSGGARMRRVLITALVILAASVVSASDAIFSLSGWAEIPSTYRRPGSPVSGQFTTGPVNGVTPPYQGQPIPGFSGVIPSPVPGRFIGLPDNGYGAQTNSADFVVGFYEITPSFKTTGDGTTSRGPVQIDSYTPFSDPSGLLDTTFINGGPVYARSTYYPLPVQPQIPVDPAIKQGHWLTGADFDVESIA